MGVAASYVFWRWLKQPGWQRAVTAGVLLGLTELAKMTWIVLFALWPLLWLVWVVSRRRDVPRRLQFGQAVQIGAILLVGLYVVNLGYTFEGSFQRLGNYRFISRTLGGPVGEGSTPGQHIGRNRFADSWLMAVPIPVPRNYLLGMDAQKEGFERNFWSYLRGEWQRGGWWYYYLYALAIKVPLGTWVLIVLALWTGLCRRGYSADWRDELVLLAPLVVLLTSSVPRPASATTCDTSC